MEKNTLVAVSVLAVSATALGIVIVKKIKKTKELEAASQRDPEFDAKMSDQPIDQTN